MKAIHSCIECGHKKETSNHQYWKIGDKVNRYCPICDKTTIFEVTEIWGRSEPVKGEQAGMLGVPGKYVEQKRPWTPGQIEIESYQKYREAMGKPKTVTPEVTVPTSVAKAIEGKTINDITIKKVRGTWWAIVKDTGFPIVGLTSKIETEAYVAKMFKLAIPKAKVPVKAETPQNLYWYSIAELKKMCQNRGLSTEGSKESLIRRLK